MQVENWHSWEMDEVKNVLPFVLVFFLHEDLNVTTPHNSTLGFCHVFPLHLWTRFMAHFVKMYIQH